MVALALTLLTVHSLWSAVDAYPITVRKAAYLTSNNITHESVTHDYNTLWSLIDSSENKAVFSQLKFSDAAFYDAESNVVGTAQFATANQYQRQPYVANGYIGSRIPNLGQGFSYDQLSSAPDASEDDLSNGWPLFNKRFAGAYIAGFFDIQEKVNSTNFPELYENGYESIISVVPQWTSLVVSTTVNGSDYTLDPANSSSLGSITNYVQNLSLSDGIVTTEFTWLDQIQLKFDVLAHRKDVSLGAVHLEAYNLGNEPITIKVSDVLDFETSQRAQMTNVGHDNDGIFIAFQPHQIDYVNGGIYSTLRSSTSPSFSSSNSSVSQTIDVRIEAHSSFQATKYVGIISSDLVPLDSSQALDYAKKVSQSYTDFDAVVASHQAAWSATLESTPAVTFPNDLLLTMASRASIYHLTANTRTEAEGVTAALSVGGLSSDSYGGMVFWDTDLWMFNGLLPFVPSHAKSLINYRIHTHEQARKNVPKGYEGAAYPWTSGRFGNCTSTGPCLDYEYHINHAVAQSAWNLYLSGAADDEYLETVAYPLIEDAARFYSDYLVKYNETEKKYVTHNLTDPDEYANHVDNGAYTNAGISKVMKWAVMVGNHLDKPVPSQYLQISDNVLMPTAETNVTLEYSGMNSSVGIKQADVIMVTYPLENELITEDQAYKNMEFYSHKQVSYGPAMTFPIFSIVASKLATSGCASQSQLHKAVQPFLRGPFAQFSEQNNDIYSTNGGTHPAFPFMTAHGGFLQAVLQGLMGLRFDYEIVNSKLVRVLKLDPVALPCLGDGVLFEGVKYNNHSLTLKSDKDTFFITNNGGFDGASNTTIRIKFDERNPRAGTYTLDAGETIRVPLYKPKMSFPSSISECELASFVNITDGAFGDVPNSINDGDNTTRWQVQTNDTTGIILVDLKQGRNVSKAFFDWGDKPPLKLKVSYYNPQDHAFENTTDFLSKVDFGNGLYNKYKYANTKGKLVKKDDIFTPFYDQPVKITEPFNIQEFTTIDVPYRHNSTTVEVEDPFVSRFLLVEVEGIHNTVPIDDDNGGAKVYQIVFY